MEVFTEQQTFFMFYFLWVNKALHVQNNNLDNSYGIVINTFYWLIIIANMVLTFDAKSGFAFEVFFLPSVEYGQAVFWSWILTLVF